MDEQVILVDQQDHQVGTMEKMEAHLKGFLHRAFSIFIFNTKGELLLQQRALNKYHSGGKWTNTCCSHPRPGELTETAAHRRLMEEMGMKCPLTPGFSFIYKASFSNDLTEHEYDHVFFGVSDELPTINPLEVTSYQYIPMDVLAADLEKSPDQYTAWLKICFDRVVDFKSEKQA